MEIVPVQPPAKPFASGTMYRTIRQGPRGAALCAKSLKMPSETSKTCRPQKCKCKSGGGSITIPSQYIQPPRVKNFAPVNVWKRPEHKLEDRTIQKMSYQPVDGDRPDPILPQNNIGLSRQCFATDTINRMSFPGWYNPCPPGKITPCNHDLLGKGRIADMTTNRHDYVPKDVDRAQPILPVHNLGMSDCPLSSKTINRLSFMPNDAYERQGPILPSPALQWPKGKLDGNTIQKMSFQPCKIPRKEFLPWAQKKKYENPTVALSGDTVYRKSYIPTGDTKRAELILPHENKNLLGDGCSFDSHTIYGMSYPGNENFVRPDPVLPVHNIHLSCQPMEGNTINKMSFQPNMNHCPPAPIRPCNHDLMGKGRLTDLTTNRVDYVPVDSDRVEPILPRPQIHLSDAPLSNRTINRLSFMDPGYNETVQKITPTHNLSVNTGRMECNTIQKMSFQPVNPVDKEDMPWAKKHQYCPPEIPFVTDTVYRMSFEAPGDWSGGGGGSGGGSDCSCADGCGCPCFSQVEVPLVG